MILGIIHKFPYLFGINPVFQKTFFFSVSDFPGASGLQKWQGQRARFRIFEMNAMGLNWRPEAQQAGNGRVPRGLKYMAAWAQLVSTSELRGRRSLLHRHSLDLKTAIKKGPMTFRERRRRRNIKPRNRESEGCRRRRSEGGNATGITSGGLHPLRRVHHQHLQQELLHHHHHDEGGVVHPLD